MNEYVSREALNRVEDKFDKFVTEQKEVNAKVYSTLEKLDETLNNLNTNLQVKNASNEFYVKEIDRYIKKIDANSDKITVLEQDIIKAETALKVVKFILFTLIPALPTLTAILMYFI